MASIPENVASLKRQELQRLCKAHKIRANMKNTEMIHALQERRQQMLIEEEDKTEEIIEAKEKNSEFEDEIALEVKSKSVIEKKTAREDKMTSEEKAVEKRTIMEGKAIVEVDSSSTVEGEENCTMEATEIEETKDMSAIEDRVEEDMKLTEDKAETMDTKIEDDTVMKERDIVMEDETANKSVVETMETTQDQDVVMDSEEERTEEIENREEEQEATMETESVRQHELVVEDSNGNTLVPAPAEGDDILNTTYTIEPPEQLVDDPDDALSSSLLNPSCDSPSTLPQGAWALGPALRDSPLLRTHQAEKENTKSEKENSSKSAHDNIMALLNARVEERKQEPGYCPKEFVDAGPASRIPVRSDIAQRFDNVHKKQFNQMTSIKDELENRKRRRTPSQNPTTNRPALHEPLRKKPKSGPQPITAPKLKPDPRKVSTEKRTLAKHHKPAASSSKQSAGRPGSTISLKTPKMPLTKSQKTPHIQPSKRLAYTPHKGPLPKYQDTVSKI